MRINTTFHIDATEHDFVSTDKLERIILDNSNIILSAWPGFMKSVKSYSDHLRKFMHGMDAFEQSFLNFSLNIAHYVHRGEQRGTGADYLIHQLRASVDAADEFRDFTTVAAAFLHDVPEKLTDDDIKKQHAHILEEVAREKPAFRQRFIEGKLTAEELYAIKYMLFRDSDLPESTILDSYATCVDHLMKTRKKLDARKPAPVNSNERNAASVSDNIDSAIDNILVNMARRSLRNQYVEQLRKQLLYFAVKHIPYSSREDIETDVRFVVDPMVSSLSRYSDLIQSYFNYTMNRSPVFLIRTSNGDIKKKYQVDIIEDHHYRAAVLKTEGLKLIDRNDNMQTMYAHGNFIPLEHLRSMHGHLVKLWDSGRRDEYNASKTKYAEAHANTINALNTMIAGHNGFDGSKRVYETFKSFISLNHVMDIIQHMESCHEINEEMIALRKLSARLAKTIADQCEMQALRIEIFNSTVDVPMAREKQHDLRIYERKGGLHGITEPYRVITSTTRYRQYDHLFASLLMPRMLEIAEGTRTFNQDKERQYMATIAIKRIAELYLANPQFVVQGFDKLLPPVLREYLDAK